MFSFRLILVYIWFPRSNAIKELFLIDLFKLAVASLQSTMADQKSKHWLLLEYSNLIYSIYTFSLRNRSRLFEIRSLIVSLNSPSPTNGLPGNRSSGEKIHLIKLLRLALPWRKTFGHAILFACLSWSRLTVQFSSNFSRRCEVLK
jgi:hypothetical protein